MNLPLSRFLRTFAFVSIVCALAVSASADNKPKTKPVKKPNPAMASVEDVAGLPRVLLIGDSISVGYTVAVQKQLEGVATDDLYTFAKARLAEIQLPANVHFNSKGSAKLAEQISAEIKKALAQR